MSIIKKIGKSEIILAAAGLSTFFSGGEALEFKYGITILVIALTLFNDRGRISKKALIFVSGTVLIVASHLLAGNISTEMLNIILFSALFAILSENRFNKKTAVWVVVWTSVIHSITAMVQQLFLGIIRPPSTFINPNWASLWILTGLYVTLKYVRTKPWLKIGASLIMLGALAAQRSRTAVLLIVLMAMAEVIRSRKKTVIAGAVILMAAAAAIGVSRFRADMSDKLAFSRGRIYAAVVDAVSERPLNGYGPAAGGHVLPGHALPEKREYSNYSIVPHMSHSSYLEILVTCGAAGLLLFCYLIGGKVKEHEYKVLLMAVMTAALFNNIEKSFSLVLLGGILLSFNRERDEGIAVSRGKAAVVFIPALFFLLFQYGAYRMHKRGESYFEAGDYISAKSAYEKAVQLDPWESFYANEYALLLLNSCPEMPWDEKIAAIEDMTGRMVKYGKYDPESYYFKAYFYNVILKSEDFTLFKPELHSKALDMAERAIKLNPRNVNYYYIKMVFHAYRNDKQSVYETWQKLLAIERYHMKSYRLIVNITDDASLKKTAEDKISEIRAIRESAGLNDYETMMMSD